MYQVSLRRRQLRFPDGGAGLGKADDADGGSGDLDNCLHRAAHVLQRARSVRRETFWKR